MRASLACSLAGGLLLSAAEQVAADVTNSGLSDFHRAGWPTMTLFAGFTFNIIGFWYGYKRGGLGMTGSGSSLPGSFLLFNLLNFFMGIFLIFGPGDAPTAGGPRVNVIGFQLMLGSSLGFYAYYSNLKAVCMGFFWYALLSVLSIMGSFPLLNHNSGIFLVNQSQCFAYFISDNPDFNRCDDQGFLQLLRTFGLFALFFLCVQMGQSFVTYTDNEPTTKKMNAPAQGGSGGQEPLMAAQYEAGTAAQQQQQQSQVGAPAPYAGPTGVVPAAGTGYQAL